MCTRRRVLMILSVFGLLEELNSGNNNDQADDRQDQEILPDDRTGDVALMEDF